MKHMILLVIGATLTAIGGGIFYWQYNLIQGKDISEGRVTDLVSRPGSKGGTVYTIVAEFRDASGKAHVYRSGFSSSNPGYKTGDRIRIFFDRKNPSDCGIMSFGYRFGVAWCFIAAGLAVLLVRGGWVYGSQWMETAFPSLVRF